MTARNAADDDNIYMMKMSQMYHKRLRTCYSYSILYAQINTH